MKFGRFTTFTLGVIFTAVTIGAVTYVSASNGATITACANKSTGTLRLLTKGACKRTETRLSWSQQGPQGLPGAKGDTGSVGTNGTNGQNLHAVDADGKDLGLITQTDGFSISVLSGGNFFNLASDGSAQRGEVFTYFRDSLCTIPLHVDDYEKLGTTPYPRVAFFVAKSSKYAPTSAYTVTGTGVAGSTFGTIYQHEWNPSVCRARNPSSYIALQYAGVWDVRQIEMPLYTAPLTIVSR